MKKGFTLIELVIVILIVGILASFAIPKFIDLQRNAALSSEKALIGSIKQGIATAHLAHGIGKAGELFPQTEFSAAGYPNNLDGAPQGNASATNPFFVYVLEGGVTDPKWQKQNPPGTTWSGYYNRNTNNTFLYNPEDGSISGA